MAAAVVLQHHRSPVVVKKMTAHDLLESNHDWGVEKRDPVSGHFPSRGGSGDSGHMPDLPVEGGLVKTPRPTRPLHKLQISGHRPSAAIYCDPEDTALPRAEGDPSTLLQSNSRRSPTKSDSWRSSPSKARSKSFNFNSDNKIVVDETLDEEALSGSAVVTRARTLRLSKSTQLDRVPCLGKVLRSNYFDALMGVIILANCVTMGFEAEMLLGKEEQWSAVVTASGNFFICAFIVEIILRCLAFGCQIYAPLRRWGGDPWMFADLMIVIVTGIIGEWILPAAGVGSSLLEPLVGLRALRIIRLVRVVRSVDWFREVWLLLRGLVGSGRVLVWTVVVVFFLTYIFAVFGVWLLGVSLQENVQALDESELSTVAGEELQMLVQVTGGVMPMMATLVQVLTLDSWMSIVRPMAHYVFWAYPFFYLYISVAVIVMMNLVTAIIVENALASSKQDNDDLLAEAEREKAAEIAKFKHMFEMLDSDGNGEITWDEFETAFADDELRAKLHAFGINSTNCHEMFELLDTGDGSISMPELFEGLAKLDGPATSADVFKVSKTNELVCKLVLQQNVEMQEDLQELARHVSGAQLSQRAGTFKRRACHSSGSLEKYDANSSMNSSMNSPSKRNENEVTLSTILQAIEASRKQSEETAQLMDRNIQACNARVSQVAADLTNLHCHLGIGLASTRSTDSGNRQSCNVWPELCSSLPMAPLPLAPKLVASESTVMNSYHSPVVSA